MTRKHIHRLAALLSENIDDPYSGLEDDDQFKQPSASGYGCGEGCWEYEEFPFMINGQHWLGTARIEYDVEKNFYKGYRATRYEPGEPDHWEVIIGKGEPIFFEIFDNSGETIYKWHAKAGKRWDASMPQEWDAGFAVGEMSDEQLQNVLQSIMQQFVQDEDEVQEYEEETAGDDDYGGGSW